MAATALPTAVSGLLAVRQGWAVALDDGAIAVGVHDTLSLQPQLVGLYTSLTSFSGSGTRLHNLGPLEFWLLAVPGRIFGPTGSGLVLGATTAERARPVGDRLAGAPARRGGRPPSSSPQSPSSTSSCRAG